MALVSVVIPAFDAAATLDEALRSARAQTWRELEIIVVDDGSHDASPRIAQAHGREDRRVRTVTQTNAGVAAARNRGIALARGEYIAFLDADDLWAPDKIARQVEALERAGEGAGAVFTYFCRVDADGYTLSEPERPEARDDMLVSLCRGNFIGNGSSILVRREVCDRIGGFDPALRAAQAQGCEDIDFFLRLAASTRIVAVPEPLTGYRDDGATMSADPLRMLRSWRLVESRTAAREPALARDLLKGRANYAVWLAEHAVGAGKWRDVGRLFIQFGPGRARLLIAIMRRLQARRASAAPAHTPRQFIAPGSSG